MRIISDTIVTINLNCFTIFAVITMVPYVTTPLQLNIIDKSSFLKLNINYKFLSIIPIATAWNFAKSEISSI